MKIDEILLHATNTHRRPVCERVQTLSETVWNAGKILLFHYSSILLPLAELERYVDHTHQTFLFSFSGGVTILMVVIDRFLGGEGTTTQEKGRQAR